MSQTESWTVLRLLTWTTEHLKKSKADSPRLDAEVLLAHARGCKRLDLYLAFEESRDQIVRNMRSVGIDLARHVDIGHLLIEASRPSMHGLETHLAQIHRLITAYEPHAIVIDPISNLGYASQRQDLSAMLLRLIDFLKSNGITALFVNLVAAGMPLDATDAGVSSLIDTWLVLRDIEAGGERNRGLYVIKSRGMQHSNQIREFVITADGIDLLDVYAGPDGGTYSFKVSAPPYCAWTISKTAPWITISGSASRTGTGTVTFSLPFTIQAKASDIRITSAGWDTVHVHQEGENLNF